MTTNSKRLSAAEENASLKAQAHTESLLARFGGKRHTFSDDDRAKSAAVRQRKAAERRERAMRFPEYARQKVEEAPEKWFEPYEKARAEGDWRAPEALMDRIYGRPAQASESQDFGEIEAGDVVEIRRLLLEAISIERHESGKSSASPSRRSRNAEPRPDSAWPPP